MHVQWAIISLPIVPSILLKVIYLGPILVFHLLANYLNMIVSEPLGEPLPESFDSTPQEWEFVRLLAQLFPEQQELVIASLHGILDANGRSRHPCFFNVDYSKNTAGDKRTMRISVGGVLLCMCKISPGHSDWPSNSVAVLSYPLLELIK